MEKIKMTTPLVEMVDFLDFCNLYCGGCSR